MKKLKYEPRGKETFLEVHCPPCNDFAQGAISEVNGLTRPFCQLHQSCKNFEQFVCFSTIRIKTKEKK